MQLACERAERHRLTCPRRPPDEGQIAAERRADGLSLLWVQDVVLERRRLPGRLCEAEQPVPGRVRGVADLLEPADQRPQQEGEVGLHAGAADELAQVDRHRQDDSQSRDGDDRRLDPALLTRHDQICRRVVGQVERRLDQKLVLPGASMRTDTAAADKLDGRR